MSTLLGTIQERLSSSNVVQDEVMVPLYKINSLPKDADTLYKMDKKKEEQLSLDISKLESLKDLYSPEVQKTLDTHLKALETLFAASLRGSSQNLPPVVSKRRPREVSSGKKKNRKRKLEGQDVSANISKVTNEEGTGQKESTDVPAPKRKRRRRKSTGSCEEKSNEGEKEIKPKEEKVNEKCVKSFQPTEKFVRDALKKSMEKENFWSVNTVKVLIERNLIPARLHGLLCDCLIKYNSLEMLKLLPARQIEERHLIKCVKHILRYLVLSLPFDEETMRNYLKLLSTDEAVVLFQFLHQTLYIVSPALLFTSKINQIPEKISETVVMSWINCLITAKLTVFVSSSALRNIIQHFNKTMRKQGSFYQHISTLEPYLKQLQNGVKLPDKNVGRYKIDTITL